jgi:hypothetical protein
LAYGAGSEVTCAARSGHLYQGRYKAILVERDCYLLELAPLAHIECAAGECAHIFVGI